ncbi:hypothetical protein ASE04_02400 [Rhizobium sp. Root708]|nr:hypothetical protein ASE04_02400 [Rhizobium sp. Root708]
MIHLVGREIGSIWSMWHGAFQHRRRHERTAKTVVSRNSYSIKKTLGDNTSNFKLRSKATLTIFKALILFTYR